MCLSSSKDKIKLLQQNSVTDVLLVSAAICWCPSGWALAWCLHIQISINSGGKFLCIVFHQKDLCDLNLGEILCIFTFFFLEFWTLIFMDKRSHGITQIVDRPIGAFGSGENFSNGGETRTINLEEILDKTRQLSCPHFSLRLLSSLQICKLFKEFANLPQGVFEA